MGNFVNPGNDAFRVALASSIYVDKTGLLEYTNKVTGTLQAYFATVVREDSESQLQPIC